MWWSMRYTTFYWPSGTRWLPPYLLSSICPPNPPPGPHLITGSGLAFTSTLSLLFEPFHKRCPLFVHGVPQEGRDCWRHESEQERYADGTRRRDIASKREPRRARTEYGSLWFDPFWLKDLWPLPPNKRPSVSMSRRISNLSIVCSNH